MGITQLRAFVTVAREGNLTRAAESLHVTQPAVGLQIKSLQSSLNLQLFTRIPSGMMLNDDGNKLLHFAERAIAAVSELRQQAESLHSNSQEILSGKLAIGTILDPEFIRLGPFLQRLAGSYPQPSTQLQHSMSGDVLRQIKAGHLDVGYYLGTPNKTFHRLTLTQFTYCVLAPLGWKSRVSGKIGQLWLNYPGFGLHLSQILPY